VTARHWLLLLVAALGVALLVGVPLGVVVVLNTWLEWTVWAVPLVLGLLTFTFGATVLTWDAMGEPQGLSAACRAAQSICHGARRLLRHPPRHPQAGE
jgi:hypothetical protein